MAAGTSDGIPAAVFLLLPHPIHPEQSLFRKKVNPLCPVLRLMIPEDLVMPAPDTRDNSVR
jgi:hypothetical protein